jgi:hypothetical protein
MQARRGILGTLVLALGALACAPTPSATPAATALPTPSPVTTPAPTDSPAPTVPPSDAPTSAAGAPACELADLKASYGFIEGAAGSRLTTVVLVSAATCSIDAFPALGIRDANGAIVVGAPSMGSGRIDLAPEAAYEANVRIANWCADEPEFPLTLELIIGGEELVVTGPAGSSFPEAGDLPPCNGGSGPILEATGWTVAA